MKTIHKNRINKDSKIKYSWLAASAILISLLGTGTVINSQAKADANKANDNIKNTTTDSKTLATTTSKAKLNQTVDDVGKTKANDVLQPKNSRKQKTTVNESLVKASEFANNNNGATNSTDSNNRQTDNNNSNSKQGANKENAREIARSWSQYQTNLSYSTSQQERTLPVHSIFKIPDNTSTQTIKDLGSNPDMLDVTNGVVPNDITYPGGTNADSHYKTPKPGAFGGFTAPYVDGLGGVANTKWGVDPISYDGKPKDNIKVAQNSPYYYGEVHIPIYKVYIPKGVSDTDYRNIWYYGRLFGGDGGSMSFPSHNPDKYSPMTWFPGYDIGLDSKSNLPKVMSNIQIKYIDRDTHKEVGSYMPTGIPGMPWYLGSNPKGLNLNLYQVANPQQIFTFNGQEHEVMVNHLKVSNVFHYILHKRHHDHAVDSLVEAQELVTEQPYHNDAKYHRTASDFVSPLIGYKVDTGAKNDSITTEPVMDDSRNFIGPSNSPANYYYSPMTSKESNVVKPYYIQYVNQAGTTINTNGDDEAGKTYRIDGYMDDSGSMLNLVTRGDGFGAPGIPRGYTLNYVQSPGSYLFGTKSPGVVKIEVTGKRFPLSYTITMRGHNADGSSSNEGHASVNTVAQVGSPSPKLVQSKDFVPDGYVNEANPKIYMNTNQVGQLINDQSGTTPFQPINTVITYNYRDDTSNLNSSPNSKVKKIYVNYIDQEGHKIASNLVNDGSTNDKISANQLAMVHASEVTDKGYSIDPNQNEIYRFRLVPKTVNVYISGNRYDRNFYVNSIKEMYNGGTQEVNTNVIPIPGQIDSPAKKIISNRDATTPIGYKLNTSLASNLEVTKPYYIYRNGTGVLEPRNTYNVYYQPMRSDEPHTVVKPIHVTYINQHNKVVGEDYVQGYMDQRENVYQLATDTNNGAVIPQGYHVDTVQFDPNTYTYGTNNQGVIANVTGNKVSADITIKRYLEKPDRLPQEPLNREYPDVATFSYMRVGDVYVYNAKDYVPKGYQVDPEFNNEIRITANPDGTLTYNGDNFIYMAKNAVPNSKNENDVKTVQMYYIDNDDHIISQATLSGYMGERVNAIHLDQVPTGYKLMPGQLPIYMFSTNNTLPLVFRVRKLPASNNYVNNQQINTDIKGETISPSTDINHLYVDSNFDYRDDKTNGVEFNSSHKSYNWFTGQPMEPSNDETSPETAYPGSEADNMPAVLNPQIGSGYNPSLDFPTDPSGDNASNYGSNELMESQAPGDSDDEATEEDADDDIDGSHGSYDNLDSDYTGSDNDASARHTHRVNYEQHSRIRRHRKVYRKHSAKHIKRRHTRRYRHLKYRKHRKYRKARKPSKRRYRIRRRSNKRKHRKHNRKHLIFVRFRR